MTEKEKLNLIEDALELKPDTLKTETLLDDIDVWDSMARLNITVMFLDNFNKKLKIDDILSFKTVADITRLMQ